jgi:hypothetical protein
MQLHISQITKDQIFTIYQIRYFKIFSGNLFYELFIKVYKHEKMYRCPQFISIK